VTCLTIIQNAADELGLVRPGVAIGNTDPQVIQLVALLNREGNNLSTGSSVGLSYDWTALQVISTFVSTGVELQGTLTTLAPGFKYWISETFWDRSVKRPIFGALTPQQWELLKSSSLTGPFPQFRIYNGELRTIPAPPAGDTLAFEYATSYWARDAGGTPKAAFTVDTDTTLLDEDLLTLGLIWRWEKRHGLDYAEDFRDYTTKVNNAIGRDGGKGRLTLGGQPSGLYPGIMVPAGSWSVP